MRVAQRDLVIGTDRGDEPPFQTPVFVLTQGDEIALDSSHRLEGVGGRLTLLPTGRGCAGPEHELAPLVRDQRGLGVGVVLTLDDQMSAQHGAAPIDTGEHPAHRLGRRSGRDDVDPRGGSRGDNDQGVFPYVTIGGK